MLNIQENWKSLKKEFTKKFSVANTNKQQCLYFYAQVKALWQGSKLIPNYIQEGETLAALTFNKDMTFLVV